MNNELKITDEIAAIMSKIHMVRNRNILLDCDVAELFKVNVDDLNTIMKSHINIFPEEFCFQLTKKEYKSLFDPTIRSKVIIENEVYLPYAYSRYGVIQLSNFYDDPFIIDKAIEIVRAGVWLEDLEIKIQKLEYRTLQLENALLEEKLSLSKREEKLRRFINNEEKSISKDRSKT